VRMAFDKNMGSTSSGAQATGSGASPPRHSAIK
jgi:hypothetical protein